MPYTKGQNHAIPIFDTHIIFKIIGEGINCRGPANHQRTMGLTIDFFPTPTTKKKRQVKKGMMKKKKKIFPPPTKKRGEQENNHHIQP